MIIRKLTSSDNKLVQEVFASGTYQPFLQSSSWGDFQKSFRHPIERIGVFDGSKLLVVALLVKHSLPFGWSYWYCPHGPVFFDCLSDTEQESAFLFFIQHLKDLHLDNGALFLKCEPRIPLPKEVKNYRIPKWKQSTHTRMLDLSFSEDELLSHMKQKTRYNIRLAQKRGVTVSQSSSAHDREIFWEIIQEVYKRHGIRTHSYEYYTLMLSTPIARLYVARFEGAVIAAGIFIFFGDRVVYLHGGSLFSYRNHMAPYLLQWTVIQDAKKEGFRYYDFGGTAPEGELHHQLSSVTRFKEGFGGEEVVFPYKYDVIFSSTRYIIFSCAKKVRSLFTHLKKI